VHYLFIEACISNSEPWAGKESKELGKTKKKDSDASDLPACKETFATHSVCTICMLLHLQSQVAQ